jgi:molybdopterin-guanine dinucleotide biosynthesis protein B
MLVFQVIGKHNSGKTTLIEYLSGELKKRNLRVVYIKHDPKGKGVTDKEGADTYRVKPNTVTTVLASPEQTTLWVNRNLTLEELIEVVSIISKPDVVIVEGFKFHKGFPKIQVGELEEDIKGNVSDIVLTVCDKKDYPKALNWVLENLT